MYSNANNSSSSLNKFTVTIERGLKEAELLFKSNQLPKAAEYLSKVYAGIQQRDPKHIKYLDQLYEVLDKRCLVYRRLGKLKLAFEDATLAIKLKPLAYKGYLCAGKISEMGHKAETAKLFYLRGLKALPKDDPGYHQLYKAYKSFNQFIELKRKKEEQRQRDDAKVRSDPITSLPYADVFHYILRDLPYRDVIVCSMVSKTWRELILQDASLWMRGIDLSVKFYKWKFDDDFHTAFRPALKGVDLKKGQIKSVKINRLYPRSEALFLNYFALDLSNRLKQLDIEFETEALFNFFVKPRKEPIFENLEALSLRSPANETIIFEILKNIPTLLSLEITISTFVTPSWFFTQWTKERRGISLNHDFDHTLKLEKLKINGIPLRNNQSHKELDWIETSLLNLKHLQLKYANQSNGSFVGNEHIQAQLYRAIKKLAHLETFLIYGLSSSHCFQFSSEFIKTINISNVWFQSLDMSFPYPQNYPVTELRLSRLSLDTLDTPQMLGQFFSDLRCKENLLHLFVEFVSIKHIFTEAGYASFVTEHFPNLRTISFSGSDQVTNATAKAIAESPNVPQNVILAITKVTDEGFDRLVKAGVKRICLQGCNVSMRSIKAYEESGVKLLTYSRFQGAIVR